MWPRKKTEPKKPASKSEQRRKAIQKTDTPSAPKVTPMDTVAVDVVAKALAMAYTQGKLQAKGHPKAADPMYLERSIGTTWQTFLPGARALISKI